MEGVDVLEAEAVELDPTGQQLGDVYDATRQPAPLSRATRPMNRKTHEAPLNSVSEGRSAGPFIRSVPLFIVREFL